MRVRLLYNITSLVLLARGGLAQTAPNTLTGTWHSVAAPPIPQTMLMIGADGYYSQISMPVGRSKPKNDFDHRTREELMKQFGGVRVAYGTWKVAGNKLIRTRTASEEPGKEGTDMVEDFRIEGDVLVLQSQDGQHHARFRRMK